LPLLLSIPMKVVTSKVVVGTAMRTHHYLLIPEKTKSPAVLRQARLHASQLAKPRLKAAPAA
jgi:membrane glycosyltransferase